MTETDLRGALLRVARALCDMENLPDEDAYDILVSEWESLCPHPGGADIIFWPNELGLCRDDELGALSMSPETMVEFAMSWKPRIAAMRVAQRSGGDSVGFYLYKLEAPGTPKTQVATDLESRFEPGTLVAVALKGMRLDDGTNVDTSFEFGVMSCGKIISVANVPIGSCITE